jgi:hypothetical protein
MVKRWLRLAHSSRINLNLASTANNGAQNRSNFTGSAKRFLNHLA